MARAVAVVFHADFREGLERLAFRIPVWMLETEENRLAAEAIWHKAHDWPQISVTLFRGSANPTQDEWSAILEQLELHHGPIAQRAPYDTLDAIGTTLTADARAALDAAGFAAPDETAEGFRATRARS